MSSSHWIILYDTTSLRVTRRVWDDAAELSLAHPAAVPGPNEAAMLYPTASFQTLTQPAENDPTLAAAISRHASSAATTTATGPS